MRRGGWRCTACALQRRRCAPSGTGRNCRFGLCAAAGGCCGCGAGCVFRCCACCSRSCASLACRICASAEIHPDPPVRNQLGAQAATGHDAVHARFQLTEQCWALEMLMLSTANLSCVGYCKCGAVLGTADADVDPCRVTGKVADGDTERMSRQKPYDSSALAVASIEKTSPCRTCCARSREMCCPARTARTSLCPCSGECNGRVSSVSAQL